MKQVPLSAMELFLRLVKSRRVLSKVIYSPSTPTLTEIPNIVESLSYPQEQQVWASIFLHLCIPGLFPEQHREVVDRTVPIWKGRPAWCSVLKQLSKLDTASKGQHVLPRHSLSWVRSRLHKAVSSLTRWGRAPSPHLSHSSSQERPTRMPRACHNQQVALHE